MPPITVFNLAEGGVNVDKNPTRTEDAEMAVCQNASPDGTRQRLGGLSKRPGLDRFNYIPLGGVVLGGIEVPYKGTAGAPTSGGGGGGAAGESGGTGPPAPSGGVGPGDAAGGGGSNLAGDPANGVLFNGGVTIFGGRRLIIIPRMQNSAATAGWYLSSQAIADAGWKLNSGVETTAGPPQGPHNTNFPDGAGYGNSVGHPMTLANGVLYYQEDLWNQTAAAAPVLPRLRKLSVDGNVDAFLLTIPDNPAILAISPIPSHLVSVTAMITEWGNGDALYVATYDQVTSGASAGKYGRILRISGLDSGAYRIQEVYNLFTTPIGSATASVPLCMDNFLGSPWFGVWHGVNTVDPSVQRIVSTGTDTWGIDKTQTVTTVASAADVTCMRTYSGKLYFGITTRDAGVAHATLYSVTPDDVLALELTGSGGVALSPTGFLSMEVFGGKLYATYHSSTVVTKIYQFDGTTWTAVYTAATAAYKSFGLVLRVDRGYLYAFGGVPASTSNSFLVTTDGTTWTEQNLAFTGNLGHGDFSVSAPSANILFGVDQ